MDVSEDKAKAARQMQAQFRDGARLDGGLYRQIGIFRTVYRVHGTFFLASCHY